MPPASVRADPGAAPPAGDPIVGNRNRWSRAVLVFTGLAPGQWYEFGACMICAAAETAAAAKDFAAIGFAFLAQDRSEVDFAHVPGLARTSMDAHGDWIAGPARPGPGADARALLFRRRFFLPVPAAEVTVVIRSWRNAQPFRIVDPSIRPIGPGAAIPGAGVAPQGRLGRDGRIALTAKPVWFRHGLIPGRPLVFKGQVIARGGTEGALARIAYRDAAGSPIPPPYPGTLATLTMPAFLDIPVHRQAYRFTLKLAPPPGAATVAIGFAAWDAGSDLALAGVPDVLLDDDLRLADLADDTDPGAAAFLARLLGRIGGSPAKGGPGAPSIRPYLDPAALAERPSPLRDVTRLRDGPDACILAEGAIRIAPHPAWALPDAPDWAADPYRSRAWRLAFQSLAWACGGAESPDRAIRDRAVATAVSWSRANPWGRPADGLSLHPACMALRLEALLGLLAAAVQDAGDEAAVGILGGEVVRHAAALAEILAQHTVAGSPLEVQVASALLAAGLALPSFPMARHWTGLAMIALRRGFEALIDPLGGIVEPSYHRRLEILTLALVLLPTLNARPDLAALGTLLDERVPGAWAGLAALFEPDGALPPFDDAPDHPDRVGWLKRLAASRARPAAGAAQCPQPAPAG
ncbi:hypothetical protein [Methylobacterium sp. SI9]|uniref:hypothetical protein n=1 Tax=Methylobacterium guangdongense TaxID=3138811 RepID=UPI00313C741B